jgi:Cu+-exporting ATPase
VLYRSFTELVPSRRVRKKEGQMAMETDPVCGMRIDPDDAVATADHDGTTYYFCSQLCHDAFVANPASYVA